MKPYYQSDSGDVVLYHGDCRAVMGALADGSVDAVVTDPPYCSGSVGESQRTSARGQGLRSSTISRFGWFTGDNMGTAGLSFLLRSIAFDCHRIVSPSGSLLFFCDWRMLSSIQPSIESAGVRYQGLVVWDKCHMGLGSGFRCQHELVLHFTMGKPKYHDASISNVIRCRRVPKSDREHQTQKPVDLLRQLIRVVTPPSGTILDPFAGSGTTLLAARLEGMKAIGIEQDESYCEIIVKRLKEQSAKEPLLTR